MIALPTATVTSRKATAVWFKDLDRWSVGGFISLGWRWPREVIRPLSTALKRKSISVDRSRTKIAALKLVTLHFNGEMEPRERTGIKPIKGRLFWADPGDVVYSKIDVRNGAIGIVPEEFGRICVTSEYPVYSVAPEVADARYIKLLFRTEIFRKKINGMISGASGRKRVQPDDLENLDVPLPPLSAQQTIIATWEQARADIVEIHRRVSEQEVDMAAGFLSGLGLPNLQSTVLPKAFAAWWREVERWGVKPNQLGSSGMNIRRSKYPVMSGRDCFTEIRHGCSASPSPKPTALEILKISAVTRGHLQINERKFMYDREQYRREFDLKAGDVLVCRTNGTLGLVGMSALVEEYIPNLIFPDKIIRIRCRSNILPAYLWKTLQMPFMRSQIEAAARTAVGNYAIGTEDLWNLELPLPPLSVQRELIDKIAMQRQRVLEWETEAHQKTEKNVADVEVMILGDAAIV